MKREIDLSEISDGKLYGDEDLVKADCNGCVGCDSCCRGMGESIILDPYDIYRLQVGTNRILADFLQEGAIEFQVVDGLILPNLKMKEQEDCCSFLNEEGRCSIHSCRPGICRLFPLARIYEDGDYQYFLQVKECPAKNKSKVKVSKWLDTPEMKKYHQYLLDWHDTRMTLEEKMPELDLEMQKQLSVAFLNVFYLKEYAPEKNFYEQYQARKESWEPVRKELL